MMIVRGRVVYVDQGSIWLARGARLLCSENSGRSWRSRGRLPLGPIERLAHATRIGRRLTRSGVHHYLPTQGIVIADGRVFRRDKSSGHFRRADDIRGSRPLSIATDGTLTCYGEYRRNPERSPVHVWATYDGGTNWEPIHEFQSVRHVHGVHYDNYTGTFWVTTGDEDDESAIWMSPDRFKTMSLVAGGSQQARVVHLLFTQEYVYFGSDTPRAPNYIYRLDRKTARIERLQPVGSSVFYGSKVGDDLFFSTAAEPSRVNRTRRAEVWHSADGDDWSLVTSLPSDVWPSRLFQYGQVMFPAGPGDGRRLFYTPQGVRGDGRTFILPLRQLGSKANVRTP